MLSKKVIHKIVSKRVKIRVSLENLADHAQIADTKRVPTNYDTTIRVNQHYV
jgi:hypothetical protein